MVDTDRKRAGRVVDTLGVDKVANGGQQGEIAGRNGGRWLEGRKDSQEGRRKSDNWEGGKRNVGDERDDRRRLIGGEGIIINALFGKILVILKSTADHLI